MNILFFTVRWVLRHFDDVVVDLAERGHDVVIAMPRHRLPKRLRAHPRITRVKYNESPDLDRAHALDLLRRTRDYAWYLSAEQEVGTFNRRRALNALVETASGDIRGADPSGPIPLSDFPPTHRYIDAALGDIDGRIPADPRIVELIRGLGPDVVLVSPLVNRRLRQRRS